MNLVIIYGISSLLGFSIAKKLCENQQFHIIGMYRNSNDYIEDLNKEQQVIKLMSVDLLSHDIKPSQILDDIVHEYDNITVLYSCGVWNHSPVIKITKNEIEHVTRIGFRAPVEVMSRYIQYLDDNGKKWQFIATTGLAGEKGAVKYNGLYNATTTALCNFARSVASEVSGSGNIVCLYSIGLFDKGQEYINNLCRQLTIQRPLSLEKIIEPICQQITYPNIAFNGAVVELSDGLFNYQEAANIMVSK
ncbi:SDR family NAD(P)-dependent oxidoreductase [Saccharospirillum salsuginis]|nr:SDR family NAD(P)-dependent oxidoreductase [Saccharospirillum salsuginis]